MWGSRASDSSTRTSWPSGGRTSPYSGGSASSEARSASMVEKSSTPLRHCSVVSGSKLCVSSASTNSASKAGQRPVVPNVPSLEKRPARPAICANSACVRRRCCQPSYLRSLAKATWLTLRLRPMPTASVAMMKSTSPFWYISTCALRVRGDSAPSTTAAPPRWRRISSAME